MKIEYEGDIYLANEAPLQRQEEIELPQSVIESFARFLVSELWKYYGNDSKVFSLKFLD